MVTGLISSNPDTFAVVSIHVGAQDPYAIPWGEARGEDFYNIWSDGVPWFAYDGLWDAWPIETYGSKLAARQAVPTDVTIDMCGTEVSGSTYDVTADVCLEAGGTGKTMRIYMVQVLDHYPASPTYYRNCLMQGAPTEDITLAPGQCQEVTQTFTFDGTSWADQENIKIIAWAQTPAAAYPAEVHQAKTLHWPFDACSLLMEWVTVGDPGNAGENSGESEPDGYGPDRVCGAVGYEYRIGTHEVTNTQYADFLNAVGATDTNGLYNASMGSGFGGITQSGSAGSFTYAAIAGRESMPVNYLSWYDTLRFANWMHNGQPTGVQDASTTEDGAYDMSLGAAVVRKPGALFFLTSEDEWYKAAYYKGGGTSAGYWDYATGSDTAPVAEGPPGTEMTYGSANYNWAVSDLTDVGAYTGKPSDSTYGTFDQSGNLWEWNEADIFGDGVNRGLRGGSLNADDALFLQASYRLADTHGVAGHEDFYIGFRLGSFVDCNDNGIPDICDLDCSAVNGVFCDVAGCGLAADCQPNGVLDECDIAVGASTDCQPNTVPDECDIADCAGDLACEDCNGNAFPDECDLAQGTSSDCHLSGDPGFGRPDECDIADGASEDCHEVGDAGYGIPDECDIRDGTVPDFDADSIPDDCEFGPPQADPDAVRKNRYISFVPDPADVPTALRVEIMDSELFPGSVGTVRWVGVPDGDGVARLSAVPWYLVWPDQVVSVGDCEIAPTVTYNVTAVVGASPGIASAALEVSTVDRPDPKYWCDVVGDFIEGAWTAPNGVVNMSDIMAALQTFSSAPTAPSWVWADLDPEVPNGIVNMTDVQRAVNCFKGGEYPFSEPGDCP